MHVSTVIMHYVEVLRAGQVGMLRQLENCLKMRQETYSCPQEGGWQRHIDGAIGEAVVAKATNRYWGGCMGDLDADDVDHYQVRTVTTSTDRLILHPDDPDDRAFILVDISGLLYPIDDAHFEFSIPGYILGRVAKRPEWWADPSGRNRPAYFVPRSALLPLYLLPR